MASPIHGCRPEGRHSVPRGWVWPGVIGWSESLRRAGLPAGVDIVVMTLRNATLVPGVEALYRGLGIRVVSIPEFAIPRGQAKGGAWYLPWHKIAAWTLTEYDTVVYMDCDMMALDTTTELFEMLPRTPGLDHYAATTFACGGAHGDPAFDYPSWTSGIMLVHPSTAIYAAMITFAADVPSAWGSAVDVANATTKSDGLYRNDQRFIAEFFTADDSNGSNGSDGAAHTRRGVYIPQDIYHIHPAMCRNHRHRPGRVRQLRPKNDFETISRPNPHVVCHHASRAPMAVAC